MAQRFSTRVLAQQCHISRNTVISLEAGQFGSTSLAMLDQLAQVLGVSTESLLTLEPVPRSSEHLDVQVVLATNLKMARNWHSWTQAELERQSGVPRSVIGHIERGGRNPHLDTVVRLAVAMSFSVESLLQRQVRAD
ncbi:helix-turn-helix domain-containing protein [Hydrogenophaga sp.]|uniref:helix-turn-helix transcriptional regulator n=1 Tax=Hydrogenophaga sp. TaxID=1904254 RepID=UPI00351D8054